jgi:hypothetical protein
MPAEVVHLARVRALAQVRAEAAAPVTTRVPCAVQAAPGAVAMVLPPSDAETEHWLTPEQAYELAVDLFNAARDAQELERR